MKASESVIGIDIGGSGSRVGLMNTTDDRRRELTGPRLHIGPRGGSVPSLVAELLTLAKETWPEESAEISGLAIGASGLASLVDDPPSLARECVRITGAPAVLAIDAVTAHLGALAGQGGAMVALGTGAIAIGHPGPTEKGTEALPWKRADGWGHLLGDRGGGAWIGRQGLELALQSHDGFVTSGQTLLAAGVRRLGPPSTWPSQFYTRDDRAGLLAEFARDVVDLARQGDPASTEILRAAGREAARSATAALSDITPHHVVLTGGLANVCDTLRSSFIGELERITTDAVVGPPHGDPLDGSLRLAKLAAENRLSSQPGFVWN